MAGDRHRAVNDFRGDLARAVRSALFRSFPHDKCAAAPTKELPHGGSMFYCPVCRRHLCTTHWFGTRRPLGYGTDAYGAASRLKGEEGKKCEACIVARRAEDAMYWVRGGTDMASNLDVLRGTDRAFRLAELGPRWQSLGPRTLIRYTREFWVSDWTKVDWLLRMVALGQVRAYRDGMPPQALAIFDKVESYVMDPGMSPRHMSQVRSWATNELEQHRAVFDVAPEGHEDATLYHAVNAFLVRRGAPYGVVNTADRLENWCRVCWHADAVPFKMPADAATHAADLFRDVFGNPFVKVPWSNDYCTSDVRALAAGIHNDMAWDRLPILADALQDAGYPDGYLLTFLRNTALPHCRGCWAVELCRHGYVESLVYGGKFAVKGIGRFSPLVNIEVTA